MAPSLSYTPTIPPTRPRSPLLQFSNSNASDRSFVKVTKCESQNPSASSNTGPPAKNSSAKLEIGSPIIVIEAPKMIKTAASVPCLRVNAGLVKAGDVGRLLFLSSFIVYTST
uniref:Uncharacterized protein n=1 Tax=Rhizophora mucronata TaxID=61149 RepID=A0A2P2JSF2_RHIMU